MRGARAAAAAALPYAAAAAAAGHTYVAHSGLNCWTGHGGTNIDDSSTAPEGLTVAECETRCDADARCTCAVFQAAKGKCWKREICRPTQCEAGAGFDAYIQQPSWPAGGNNSRNVLYVLYDDMRPDLSFYGAEWMHTPNLQRLADTGVVFDRAYVQQAVCAPSRMSFTTGRRPNGTKTWNFINHFREATCEEANHVRFEGVRAPTGSWATRDVTKGNWVATGSGGFAQCCTSCTVEAGCAAWTYQRGNCTLLASVTGRVPCAVDANETLDTCVSGQSGAFQKWTTLPQNFRENGYLTLGVGKYFHDGCASKGGAAGDLAHPAGAGKPPGADAALSWTDGAVQFPSVPSYEQRWGSFTNSYGTDAGAYLAPIDNGACGADYCTFDVPLNGSGAEAPFPDFIGYNDAIAKLQYAAENRRRTGQPFFLLFGVRRPHLNWRVPVGYADLYPADTCALPKQRVLDKSIDPVAYTVFPMSAPATAGGAKGGDFVRSPYESGTDNQLRELRRHYYAAISWADYATGRVLDELDTLGLGDDTLTVMHSDHGWHLGEYAMWEKRSNWELGTRVPLVIRAPWLGARARGVHTRALAEIVDVYQTVCDLMDVPLPDDSVPFEGTSLRPVLEDPGGASVKDVALSTFARCLHKDPGGPMPIYGSRGQSGGHDNSCLDVERTDFTYMGYTMRTDRYRYTEWVGWNGTALSPVWSQLRARELYDHANDTGAWTDPDAFENVNLAPTADPALLDQLSEQLHRSFGFPA